jgi:hypothetical protein
MDVHDSRFPQWIARSSRRNALRAGAGGLAAALAAADRGRAARQEATPAAGEPVAYLFIQSFASGTFTPKEEASDSDELTLVGGTGHTIYFADRPNRDVGAVPTADVLATIGFDPTDPPNAGLVAETDDGEWIVILELMNPKLSEETGTLTYEVRRVTDYAGEGLQSLVAEASAEAVPGRFGPASLFIDSHFVPPPHGY